MKFKAFLKSSPFYWLLLFIILYFSTCQTREGKDVFELYDSDLIATIIVDQKYLVRFFTSNSKLHIYPSKNIPLNDSKKLDELVLSEKSNRDVYLELAGKSAIVDYVDAIEDTDEKKYKRVLVINNDF